MAKFSKRLGLKLAALTAATVGLSGCMYDMGLGYYDDGYSNYDCDPYSPYDSYYQCDSSYGFYNIGFGGGWYDSYWYPGYGYYLFDNYGRRHNMGDHHRRYWGERRHQWYREHHGRRGDGRGHGGGGRGRDHRNGAGYGSVDQPIAWPEGNGGRRGERPGRRAQPTPPPTGAVGDDWGRRDGDGRRGGRGDGRGRGGWGNGAPPVQQGAEAVPVPQPTARPGPDRRGDGGGRGRGGRGEGRWQQPSGGAMPQGNAAPPPPAAPRAAPPPRAPRADRGGERPSRGRPDRVED
jgi:hypothetical protein